MILELLLKTFIPVSRILDDKNDIPYFLGIFENPAPVKYGFKKQNKKIFWNINITYQYYTNASKNNR